MKKSVKVIITGSILLVTGAVGGVVCTVLGMVHTFNQLGTQPAGPATTQHLATGIQATLLCTGIGFAIAFVGLCLAVGGAIAYFVQKSGSGPEGGSAIPIILAAILVLVIVVFGAILVMPDSQASHKRRMAATRSNMNTIAAAISAFQSCQHRLPDSLDELTEDATGHAAWSLNLFSMGAWATGFNMALAAQSLGVVKSVGPDVDKALRTMEFFGNRYPYILNGYPPFLKHLIDEGEKRGFNWKNYAIHILVGGEGMSEGLRDYLLKYAKTVFSGYGASDLEIGIRANTPF